MSHEEANSRQTISDEPTRLKEIVVPMLASDSNQIVRLGDSGIAKLLLGAADQDDCAAYSISGDMALVAGSDYIRGVGFHLFETGYLTEYDLGWYLAGANLSDVAAMGAKPLGLLSVIRYPKELPDMDFQDLLRGITEGCREAGALNVGGDIGSADDIILSGSAFGIVERSSILSRKGASPGDLLVVTGQTGEAGAAMKLSRAGLLDHLTSVEQEHLLSRWRRVRPRIREGRAFATSGVVTSCIDTSDGLKAAILSLARASEVKISVESEWLPRSDAISCAARLLGCSAETLIFGDSVDFELVATVNPSGIGQLTKTFRENEMTLHLLGRVYPGEGAFYREGGRERFLPGQEWRH